MKQTAQTSIPIPVKKEVAKRDSFDGWPCCIYCGKPAPSDNPTAYSNAHFIPRSLGGLGIEENILTLCPHCHHLYDRSPGREKMREFFTAYLKSFYPDWEEKNMTYRRNNA